jgi:mannosylglycerate hydrolase
MTIRQPEEHSEPRLPEPRLPEPRLPERRLLEVRLLVHTHWDREWYRPFSQFRARLVALIDDLLEGRAGEPFLLDGQAVVLEDYLELRPERSADFSNALRQGVIEAGPWYVLADTLIPSGEGLVRNLLAGRRVLRSLRALPPDVLYCPDSFGHPASLPSIATGFGCSVVILWRGYGGRSHPPGDTARWVAPDESAVILYHLPPDGYEFGSHLPPEPEAARGRWQAMRAVLDPRAVTGMALLPVGADHHAPPLNLEDAIRTLQSAAAPHVVERTSLARFGRDLGDRAERVSLPAVRGELRDSYGYTWTLQGTLGARAGLKRRYAAVESLLIRDVEPWAALAKIQGDRRDRRALVRAAWKPVLLCQPHDTLCGCSVDEVADAMSARLMEARSAAEEIRGAAIMALAGHEGNEARRQPTLWSPVVLVRNAAARLRTGVAEIDVDVVLDDAPVGPASAGIEPRAREVGSVSLGAPAILIQELERERTFAREEASRHYPWNRVVERRRMLAWVSAVPGYGLVTLPIDEKRRRAAAPPSTVSGEVRRLVSDGLRIEAHHDRVSLGMKDGGEVLDWIVFEIEGERGDLYTHSAIPGTPAVAKLARSRLTERGPLRAELTCDWRLKVPERRLTSATGMPRRSPSVRLDLQTIIQLDAGAPFARILVRGDNTATDVRLRIGLRTGLKPDHVVVDAAFGQLARERTPTVARHTPIETAPPTAPLQRHVSVFGADRGATVCSDGLAEYEVDDDGVVWITLLRAVGELSRHNLPERPGHAGYPVATPAAQAMGPFEAEFAFAPHGARSDDVTGFVEQIAEDFLLPLRGDTWRTAINPPAAVAGAALHGTGLAVSALKESEDGDWLVLRCTNLLDQAVPGAWQLDAVREAALARLDETREEPLPVQDGRIEFTAPARGIVTILAR